MPSTTRHERKLDTGGAIPVPHGKPIRGLLTSLCEDVSCTRLHLASHRVEPGGDGEPETSEEASPDVWFDTATGTLGSVDPSDEPEAVWLRTQLDTKLESLLRSRWARHHEQRDRDAWRRFDWSRVAFGDLPSYHHAFPGAWDTLLLHEGARYWVEDLYCINPRCSCRDVHLVFSEIRGHDLVGVGYVTVSIDALDATASTSALASTLWGELSDTGELVEELPARRLRMREIGRKLHQEGLVALPTAREPAHSSLGLLEPETFRRTSPKVGRNESCPCGSGRKYKRCCLGKGAP